MAEKQEIIDAIKSIASIDGKTPGIKTFENRTGIKRSDWLGRYWPRWEDAVREAGYKPNALTERIDDATILEALANATLHYRHLPTDAELRMLKKDGSFAPSTAAVARAFRGKRDWVSALLDYCRDRSQFGDVVPLCEEYLKEQKPNEEIPNDQSTSLHTGEVYLFKMSVGRENRYKIGKTVDSDVRLGKLAAQLPEKLEKVHTIETDDAFGIEAYWHKRFANRRREGEWFQLTAADIKAFKRRKFQ